MASNIGIRLLSSLRKTRSKSALYDTPRSYFIDEEELGAFDWLVQFVEQHNAWPAPGTFRDETGITTQVTLEPISFYQERARKRALWESMMPVFKDMRSAMGNDQDPDEACALAEQMLQMRGQFGRQSQSGLVSLDQSIIMVENDFNVAKRTIGLRGIPTGYQFFDEITEGFQRANLYTTVARPGVGKTYKLLKHAKAARDAGFSVLFLTMEMGIVQVGRRFFGMETSIDPHFLRSGKLSSSVEAEMRRQSAIMQDTTDKPGFWWLAGNFKKSIEGLKAAAYETGADLIIADASYLLKPSDRTKFNKRHEILGDVMQGIADLSTALDRPVVQSVQFNRMAIQPKASTSDNDEERTNPVAHMSLDKIANSDEIGQLSSVVEGVCLGEAPHQATTRYSGLLKGREGEQGWYKYNYRFRPYNMDQIATSKDARANDNDATIPQTDLGFMAQ